MPPKKSRTTSSPQRLPFKPRARLLLLLGDQLIRDAGVAIFELVKNAYDADSEFCHVEMHNVGSESAKIVVSDSGEGMTWETVTGVWLEPGTDHKAEQRRKGQRSKKFKRLPLGEKGVGRFAVHKLGRNISLVTRARGQDEIVVNIDWSDFEAKKYLKDVPVEVSRRQPEVFTGRKTGTRIEVTDLWEKNWTKAKIRDLHRAVTAICSPFGETGEFWVELALIPDSDELKGLLLPETVLDLALFRASGKILGTTLTYDYEFTPLPEMEDRISGRSVEGVEQTLSRGSSRGKVLDLSDWEIGEVSFNLHIYDRDPGILSLTTSDKKGLKKYLDTNGGLRVYRDRVRVYDFGEPGNDWLNLDGRRVNVPTVRMSNNQIIGAVNLDAESSTGLIEKTNREGFIENDAYEALREAVLFTITQIEAERRKDKEKIREQFSGKKLREPVLDELDTLRSEIEKRKLEKPLGKYLDRIESQFRDVRDRLLTAASPGLTLSTVIHEVEKIIKETVAALRRRAPHERISELVFHLSDMVDGLGFILRKSGKSNERASTLIEQSFFNVEYRLKAHGIRAINGIVEEGDPDFKVNCVRRLIVSTMMNLIDNSIHWLNNKQDQSKIVYVGTTYEVGGKPSIVVADNGPGFIDPPEYMTQPFFTRKSDGMGLGLHLADEVAKVHKGRLVFPEDGEVSLPDELTGAVILFQFAKDV